jgi:type II secretory pathway component PulJ
MATLNELLRQRKGALKQLLSEMKTLDGRQELLQRDLRRLIMRKNKVPEVADLSRILSETTALDQAVTSFANKLKEVSRLFTTM